MSRLASIEFCRGRYIWRRMGAAVDRDPLRSVRATELLSGQVRQADWNYGKSLKSIRVARNKHLVLSFEQKAPPTKEKENAIIKR